jgi:hypothetical protein
MTATGKTEGIEAAGAARSCGFAHLIATGTVGAWSQRQRTRTELSKPKYTQFLSAEGAEGAVELPGIGTIGPWGRGLREAGRWWQWKLAV